MFDSGFLSFRCIRHDVIEIPTRAAQPPGARVKRERRPPTESGMKIRNTQVYYFEEVSVV